MVSEIGHYMKRCSEQAVEIKRLTAIVEQGSPELYQLTEDQAAEIKQLRADNAKKVTLQCWKCSSILAIPLCRACAIEEVQG